MATTVGLFLRIPGSFVPSEDQGYIFSTLQLPDGATLERTRKMADDMVKIISANRGVQNTIGIIGFDLIGGGNKSNAATMFVPLKEWDERGANTAQVIARDRQHRRPEIEADKTRALLNKQPRDSASSRAHVERRCAVKRT